MGSLAILKQVPNLDAETQVELPLMKYSHSFLLFVLVVGLGRITVFSLYF